MKFTSGDRRGAAGPAGKRGNSVRRRRRMVRTTLRWPDVMQLKAKEIADRECISIQELLISAVRNFIKQDERRQIDEAFVGIGQHPGPADKEERHDAE